MDYFLQKSLENLRYVTGADVDILEVGDGVLEIEVDEIVVASFLDFETDRLIAFLNGMKCAALCNL